MRANEVMGIVFPNAHDDLMAQMTVLRSMGAVPFGARYRLIDFSLSNLVNAGITKVGVITRANYQSLMDHLGSGKPWDLDRKKGGIFFLPPYGYSETRVYTGHVDALQGAMSYIRKAKEQYVVLCDADVISNIDLSEMLAQHEHSGADVTVAYKKGKLPKNHRDIMSFYFNGEGRATEVLLSNAIDGDCDYSLDIVVIRRELLISLVAEASAKGKTSLWRDVLQPQADTLKIYGYKVDSFAAVMDGIDSYVAANTALIECPKARQELFCKERPVYTKTRDDMPTKYGLEAKVTNSLVADGCIIEGEVKNCVLFRGVMVGKGAVLENCIIMQDCSIGEGSDLKYVVFDKNVTTGSRLSLCGAENFPVYIDKGQRI